MASVRITHEIKHHVKERINALFRQRISAKKDELDHLNIGQACYEKYVPKRFRQLAEELNSDPDGRWVDSQITTTIKVTYTNIDGQVASASFVITFKPPVPLPKRFTGEYYQTPGPLELTEDMEPYKHVVKILHEIEQLQKENNVLLHQIGTEVLGNCTTLRQVLEVWPTALDFMPDEVRQRHYSKSEKRKNTTTEIQISDETKVLLMKARMSQGS